ncbi:MAG: hypothetical protein ACHQ49_04405 [Elusimicrobiota bacterium]
MTAAANPAAAKRLCQDVKTEERSLDQKGRALVSTDAKAYCDIYVDYVDLHERVAKLAVLLGIHPGGKGIAFEEKRERLYLGLNSAEACSAVKGAWTETESCLTARLYRKAYTQKNPDLCGGSGLCRALMGQPAGCGVYAEGHAAPDGPENNRKLFFESLLQTQRDMVALAVALDGAKDLPGYSHRKKQVADLMSRCKRMVDAMTDNSAKHRSKAASAESSGP